MIIVITYAVKDRYLGYFASCMNEISTGVFISMTSLSPFKDTLIDTIDRWWKIYNEGSITILWKDNKKLSKISFKNYGQPKRNLISFQSILLTKLK